MLFFKENLISLITIVDKELVRVLRIWPQTVLPSVITVMLYYSIFGNFVGSRVGSVDGYSYIDYVAPGLIIMSIVNSSYSNVVSSFFASKFNRNIEELLISPTYYVIIILGYVLGGVFRSLMVCFFVIIVSFLFFNIYIYNIFLALFVCLLTSILFSLAGFLNGIFAKKFDDVSIIPTFMLTPLVYFGGVFYSIEMLPANFSCFVFFNPFFYVVSIFRYSVLGISDVNLISSILVMIFFILFLFLFCLYLLIFGYNIKK